LARIRQGNIDKKESVSISDIIHNYEIAFSMGKKKNGVMEYYQPLVLSDGTTTVSAIQLLFSDNIVKVNPVPLPPAIDISLKDRHEKGTTISYGYESNVSTNWITITDNNKEEFLDLKRYLGGEANCDMAKDLTLEQLKTIAPHASKANRTKYLEPINQTMTTNDINTVLRKAHFLGTILHESGSLRYTREGGVSNESYGGFPGRGLIQITGKDNYTKYGLFVNEDVTSTQENKEKMEKLPHSVYSAGWFWSETNLNPIADDNDLLYISYRVNGAYNNIDDRMLRFEDAIIGLEGNICLNKTIRELTNFSFENSRIYNFADAAFKWGIWHDEIPAPMFNPYNPQVDAIEALKGYARAKELWDINRVNTILTKPENKRSSPEKRYLNMWYIILDKTK